ncbi:UDP-N-acetylglucosamine 4-epimerase [Catovirus CTV1]|uniref:UDP-N-acetylglucosamine 4-epimerase n=1 Tax=Catovirus CTV1 TaxID=1977631 RepID=A0A1V0SAI6_9VIRU|nr:UDP-N-acetylglucosamine 4-epimerase [Catovirus CTV1]
MKKILVTGGAGFIGSHVCEFLLKNNFCVKAFDNLSTGNKNNIQHLLKNKNFEFVYGDICNLENIRKVCKDIDLICNLAAIPSVPRSIEDPLTSHNANVNGFFNILLVAKEMNIKRIVYASSSSVYGDNAVLPKKEENIGNQMSPYALNKYIDELYGKLFGKLYGLETIGLRFFNVFGPRQDPLSPYSSVISKFITNSINNVQSTINGNGDYSRDFTYVDNVVHFIYLSLTTNNEKCYGSVYNVGCGDNITILELYKTINDILKSNMDPLIGTVRKGDVPHSCADISKGQYDLGYSVQKTFKEGIRETIEWYKTNHNNI